MISKLTLNQHQIGLLEQALQVTEYTAAKILFSALIQLAKSGIPIEVEDEYGLTDFDSTLAICSLIRSYTQPHA